jgi:hypothetical protein
MSISMSPGKYLRITGLTIIDGSGTNAGTTTNGIMNIGGNVQGSSCTWTTPAVTGPCFRFDHNHFKNPQLVDMVIYGWVYGVIDHNIFDLFYGPTNGVRFNMGGYNNEASIFGDGSWNDVENFGSGNFMFMENNTFNWTNATPGSGTGFINDCSSAGRFVIRNNTMNGLLQIQTHPIGGDFRGCRAYEVYNNFGNTFNDQQGSSPASFPTFYGPRMGDGMVWGNNVSNYSGIFNTFVDRDGSNGHCYQNPPQGFGQVSGNTLCTLLGGCTCGSNPVSNWDQNGTNGYASLDQMGRGKGDLLTGQHCTAAQVSAGTCACGQNGKYDSTLGACTTVNGSYPRQALSPTYIWGNAQGTGIGSYAVSQDTFLVQENREFYCELPNVSEAPAFNGTAGMGCGAGATAGSVTATCAHPLARPATCTPNPNSPSTYDGGRAPGVGYWNDENASPASTLYVCTASNTWTQYYQPYTYPHPLVGSTTGVLSFSPISLSFGSVNVGSNSTALNTTLTNNSGSTATISLAFGSPNGGDFSQTNTCGATLFSGASCVVSVTFTPGSSGSRSSTLTQTGASNNVALSGTGVTSTPTITFNPSSINFGVVATGSSSSAQTITLTNTGTAVLRTNSNSGAITCPALGYGLCTANFGDFSIQSTTCGSTLGATSSCTFSVIFSPTTTQNRTTALSEADSNATNSPQTVSLTGTGGGCMNVAIGNYILCGAAYNDIPSGLSTSVAYTPTPGNSILIVGSFCGDVNCFTAPTQIATATDNAGSGCEKVSPNSPFNMFNTGSNIPPPGDGERLYMWFCPTIPSGVTGFNVNIFSGGVPATAYYIQIDVAEFKYPNGLIGFENIDSLTASGNTLGTTATVTTGSLSTVSPNDLVVAMIANCGATMNASPGVGYTGIIVNPTTTPGHILEAKGVTSVGPQTATTTWTGTAPAICRTGTVSPGDANDTWFGVIAPIQGIFGSGVLSGAKANNVILK